MFFYTDTAYAPWTVVKSDDKKRARLNAMRHVLHTVAFRRISTPLSRTERSPNPAIQPE